MELDIDVYDLLAKEQIRHMKGSSLTCAVIGCTTVVSNARHTIRPAFAV